MTSDFTFVIDFQDACQTATVVPQVISLPPILCDGSSEHSILAFRDTVDVGGGYGVGICGEKIVTLDAGNLV